MNRAPEPLSRSVLHTLTPDLILTLAEQALGVRCANLCRPLASYINRVYELETKDRAGLIVKFYRPGRWSTAGTKRSAAGIATISLNATWSRSMRVCTASASTATCATSGVCSKST